MSFGNIDAINSWKYSNFINTENALVIVAAIKMLYASVWLIEAWVSGRLFGAWK